MTTPEQQLQRADDHAQQLDVLLELRPEVLAFALAMEKRLREKEREKAAGWKHKPARGLAVDLCSKAMALDNALVRLGTGQENLELIRRHAVDCGNYALFIADVAGVLEVNP